MKDLLAGTADAILRPKKRNLMSEENMVFHHVGQLGTEQDQEQAREVEMYRRRFEEAMIKIED